MAFSGDLQKGSAVERPSIRLESKVHFNDEGLVIDLVEDSTHHSLSDAIQVIDGDICEVLHLIGYRIHDIKSLLEKDVLKATDEVNESLQKLGQRSPGSHILVHNNRLYGVVVDESNNCRVVGRITSVVPNRQQNDGINLVIVDNKGVQTYCRSKDCDLKQSVNGGAVLCMTSYNGFAFVAINGRTNEEIPELALVLYRGYILFEGLAIDWIRLETGLRINEFRIKRSTIADKECIICLRGGYVRQNDRLILYGSQSGVLQFDAFVSFTNDLQTIDSESRQHIITEDINELSDKKSDSVHSVEDSIETLSSLSIDSVYDNLSPDSFS